MKQAKLPNPKVAVLRIPEGAWAPLTPQQQLLHIVQQMVGFMASEFFPTMEGVTVEVLDPTRIGSTQVVLQVGSAPDKGVISVN